MTDTKCIAELQSLFKDMEACTSYLEDSIKGIRSDSINAAFIYTFKVEYNGNSTPLEHVCVIMPRGRQLVAKLFDDSISSAVLDVLSKAGFNVYKESRYVVVINIPNRSGQDKKDIELRLTKLGEEAKIAIRQVRKSYRNKCGSLDEKDIQEVTDQHTKYVDSLISDVIDGL